MIVIEDIHRKIANELGIKESIVEEVNRIQYEVLSEEMKSGKNGISLIHIGKWLRREYKTWIHNGVTYHGKGFTKEQLNENNIESES